MTIEQAINRLDERKQNIYSREEKIKWLSQIDAEIYRKIMQTHEGCPAGWVPYTEAADIKRELLAGEPWDEMYIHWLESRVDYYDKEFGEYNNSYSAFASVYGDYARAYNREHMPVQRRSRFF